MPRLPASPVGRRCPHQSLPQRAPKCSSCGASGWQFARLTAAAGYRCWLHLVMHRPAVLRGARSLPLFQEPIIDTLSSDCHSPLQSWLTSLVLTPPVARLNAGCRALRSFNFCVRSAFAQAPQGKAGMIPVQIVNSTRPQSQNCRVYIGSQGPHVMFSL